MTSNTDNNRKHLKDNPFKMPDGFLDSFQERVMKQLPEYPEAPKPVEGRSVWQKIMPYMALAAMFAGIWCMMKVFHVVSQPSYTLDNPPEAVVLAMNDPETYEYYSGEFMADSHAVSVSDADIEDDLEDIYSDDMDDLGKDLGISLKPEYENIVIK